MISYVLGTATAELAIAVVPAALPAAEPVPVVVQDVSRVLRKRPASAWSSQCDRNLSRPSSEAQAVVGAPPEQVSEAGAPENVLMPPIGAVPAAVMPPPPAGLSALMRRRLQAIATEPALGCSTCRRSAGGCGKCRQKRDAWRLVHQK